MKTKHSIHISAVTDFSVIQRYPLNHKSFQFVQVIVNETNTQFIEHIIFIMKNVLEAKYDNEPPENLGHTSIEQLMLDIVRYVRHLVRILD